MEEQVKEDIYSGRSPHDLIDYNLHPSDEYLVCRVIESCVTRTTEDGKKNHNNDRHFSCVFSIPLLIKSSHQNKLIRHVSLISISLFGSWLRAGESQIDESKMLVQFNALDHPFT
ncbi:hypothetical protein AVEN_168593-1 [Araneus ventricosus]|uniref:Uncharacterized protein n=1 Tax=Araneus ventricosus TaxID=182803 RepID=A0A4Y2GTS0_ARAVE|nr:hypothetical protein AVEN_168593-1 [Araneus ventricosus]